MTETELLTKATMLVGSAGVIAAPTGAIIEVVRKRIKIDGKPVLALAFVASLLVTGLVAQPQTVPSVIDAVAVALFASVMAMGADLWARKIASSARQTVVVDSSTKPPELKGKTTSE